jgi:hypothetical protein
MDKNVKERRSQQREEIRTAIECIVAEDVINATSVNISDTGIRIETTSPILFEMRLKLGGEMHQFKARLCWSKMHEDGSAMYGLEFIEEEDVP